MEAELPAQMAGMLEVARRSDKRTTSRHRVVQGAREHLVIDLNADGFVIEADGRPPLRGYAEIFTGAQRMLYGLVTCAWADDGLVGYEFKRDNSGCEVPADHVLPDHAGLLPAPDG